MSKSFKVIALTNILVALALIAVILASGDRTVITHFGASGLKTYGSPLALLAVPVLALGGVALAYGLHRQGQTRAFSVGVLFLVVVLQLGVAIASFLSP